MALSFIACIQKALQGALLIELMEPNIAKRTKDPDIEWLEQKNKKTIECLE